MGRSASATDDGATGLTTSAGPAPELDAVTSLVLHHRSGAHILPLAVGADVVVGRGEDCTVVLDDRGLSRRHASFRLTAEGHVTVTDLGSTNGMFVHGKRVTDAVLGPGDEITLAGVTASLHSLRLRAGAILELEGHEAFRRRLDAELARARFFRRPTAVLMVRALEETAAPLRRWSPLVQERVRIVDSLAMYSDATLELLLPEASLVEAVGIARAITTGVSPALGCGVASYPAAASSAEELLEQARDLMRATTAQQPVRVANEGVRTLSAPDADAPVCESAPMRELYRTAARVAKSPLPILILAETGAGKEVLAHFVHDTSPRRSAPMVSVNCGAIPETLLESTLFGHEKGAFTGAATQHRGVFESAAGGTVFLDEIGELPSAAQAALLRVLEQKAVVRVGATKPIEADVRVIAATHRNLAAMVQEGRFRQDLLYRLNAMTLTIPPLRERTEEIALLADRFLRRANAANGTALRGISFDALSLLLAHAWPGNVRELKNVIERAAVIAEGNQVEVEDLPLSLTTANAKRAPRETKNEESGPTDEREDFRTKMDRLEAEVLLDALRRCDWNQTRAAKALGMPLRTLVHKIKAHNLKRLGFGPPES